MRSLLFIDERYFCTTKSAKYTKASAHYVFPNFVTFVIFVVKYPNQNLCHLCPLWAITLIPDPHRIDDILDRADDR